MGHPDSRRKNRSLALAIAGILSAAPLCATAADEPAAAQPIALEEVVITGSSIKGIQAEGALPVQVFANEDIQRSGATSVTDFVQKIPAMQGFTSIADSVGGGGGGITTASIHDVGEQYTLVLLNGRRVAPATSGTTIDLNSIPLAAIERIEVLTDGASALYGADAIAGVVNFILKSGEAPLSLTGTYKSPQHSGGKSYNFALSKGWGDLNTDGFEAFIAASYDSQDQLAASQRPFASTGIISGTQGSQIYDFFNGSSRSVPPNVDVRGPGIGGTSSSGNPINSISFSPYREDTGTCPPAHVAIGRQCFFDYASSVLISPEIERKAIYGSGEYKVGDSEWSIFGNLAYTEVGTTARIAPYPAEFGMATDHPYFTQYVTPFLTDAQAAVATSANVKYRLYDMGNRTYEYNQDSLHVVGGVNGDIAGWDVTGAVTFSNQKQPQNYKAGFPLADEFNAALDAGEFDPFPYVKGEMPADQLEALLATQYIGNYNTTKIDMMGFDANAQRALFSMAGGDSVLSFGFDYRDTSYKQTPNSAVANAEILFDDVQPSYDLSRDNWGAYAEFLAPVAESFDMTASVRYDSISGTKDSITKETSGSTESQATYKIGAKWQAIESLAFRASYGTGFRVASMREIAGPQVDFGVTSGTYNCPFNASYDPLGYFAAGYICADGLQYEMFQGGNPDLAPETSKQWNVGVLWQPIDAFSMGLNFWSVEVSDGVSSVSEQLILENPETYLDLYTTKFKASNSLTYVAIIDAPINIGKIQNEGIDWDFNYTQDFSFGAMRATLAGTYLSKSKYTVPGTDDVWTTSLNAFGVNDAVSLKNVINAMVTLTTGNWENTLAARWVNGYKDQAYSEDDCIFLTADGDCTAGRLDVPAYYTFDWQTSWSPAEQLTVVLGIENIADEDPPLSLRVNGAGHQLGYDPRYASALGRTYSLTATFRY
jgi:iron complex outermembrane receptor protein